MRNNNKDFSRRCSLFKLGLVTIAGRPDKDLHPKTLKSILKQAGIMEAEDD